MEKKAANCGKTLLASAGWMAIALAVFQGVISVSPSLSLYWGAPADLVTRPIQLLVTGEIAALIFASFGLYAFSGAGLIRRLPFLRTALVIICALFIARGMVFIPQAAVMTGCFKATICVPVHMLLSSVVSLVIGFVYFAGIVASWRLLKTR